MNTRILNTGIKFHFFGNWYNILSYYVRSIDHNIPAGRVFEIVNYWQILLVNPPIPDFGRSEAEEIDRSRYHLAELPSNWLVVKT